MNEESTFGASFTDHNNYSNSSQAYLKRAALAVEDGDSVLGIHLYMAAYERALRENRIPNEDVIAGMDKAWQLAIDTKQRSLAEYIFEKLEPFWSSEEMEAHAEELQQLAFDKLEEYGFDRELVEGMADMVSQDLSEATEGLLCRFEEQIDSDTDQDDAAATPVDEDKAQNAPIDSGSSASSDARHRPVVSRSQGAHSERQIASSSQAAPTEGQGGLQSDANTGELIGDVQSNEGSAQAEAASEFSLASAFAQFSSLAFGSGSQDSEQEAVQPSFDFNSLVGFDQAIEKMNKIGVGRSKDPEFVRFVEMLSKRHGLSSMPGLGTLVFRSAAREDANCFMVATVGELGLPAIRMRLDRNPMGQVVLCVMASQNFKARLSGVSRSGFETPTVVVLEDLDLWDLPFLDAAPEDMQSFLTIQLSRGAREALALIQTALTSSEVTVLVSASEPENIDPFFWDLIGDYRIIDVDLPDEQERRAMWRSEQAQHPSMRGLNVSQLVEFSRSLSRFEIFAISNEAVEEAYRRSVEHNKFCAVETDDMLMHLSNYQPLNSQEYQRLEDIAVEKLRKELSDFDDLLKG